MAAITGGGTGIGYQVARAYAEAGADIALFYYTTVAAVEKAAGLEKEFGIKAKAYKVPGMYDGSTEERVVFTDCEVVLEFAVTDSKIVTDSINQVVEDFGRLDIFVSLQTFCGPSN